MVAFRTVATAFVLVACAGCTAMRPGTVASRGSPLEYDDSAIARHRPADWFGKSIAKHAVAGGAVPRKRNASSSPSTVVRAAEPERVDSNPTSAGNEAAVAKVEQSNQNGFKARADELSRIEDSESAPMQTSWLRATSNRFVGEVWQDHTNLYDWETIGLFGVGLGAAAASANTTIDSKFDGWFQHHVRSDGTDALTHNIKWLGDGTYTIPIAVGFFALSQFAEEMPYAPELGTWGNRTLRGFAVGAIPMLAMQQIIGSARPGQSDEGSQWTPFTSSHGVSGDAFMGAMPFLAAVGMTENRFAKALLYAASALPALGRINDDKHYLSQAALGWFMAYLSMMAVDDTDQQRRQGQIVPILQANQFGISAEYRW